MRKISADKQSSPSNPYRKALENNLDYQTVISLIKEVAASMEELEGVLKRIDADTPELINSLGFVCFVSTPTANVEVTMGNHRIVGALIQDARSMVQAEQAKVRMDQMLSMMQK